MLVLIMMVFSLSLVSFIGTLPVLMTSNVARTSEHLEVVEGRVVLLLCVFVILFVSRATVVPIWTFKTTGITLIIVDFIIYCVGGFWCMMHTLFFYCCFWYLPCSELNC